MSSREEEKAQAREARLAAERDAQAGDRRKRRLAILGGVVGLAAVAIVLAIVLSQSGVDDKPKRSSTEAASLFEGIPQDGPWLGNPDAPIVVEEYIDMQCPYCAEFSRNALPSVIADEVKSGRIRIRARTLTILGNQSTLAGQAVVAAGLQDRQWQYTEAFYADQGEENSGYVTDDFLRARGDGIAGLDVSKLMKDRTADPAVAKRLREDATAAAKHRVEGTPTLLAGRKGEALKPLQLQSLDAAGFRSALQAVVGQT
jgi:protein-disulfide isomerase